MQTIDYYNQYAEQFDAQYSSLDPKVVHQLWLDEYLPKRGSVLDVGAGNGRDALYFAQQGLNVVAIEPAVELFKKGRETTQQYGVKWLDDSLPELNKISALKMRFDVILLSAVWMHIAPADRERAFRKLSNLLKPGGVLITTLRHGDSPDNREMHTVTADELAKLSHKFGLVFRQLGETKDQLCRRQVRWETIVTHLPDDGTGYFPIIRNIVINDAKSSTYKLALLRTLLRVADGHPGSVIDESSEYVALPLGLIALYWMRQYKPLLQAGIKQSTAANLGFVKKDGWLQIEHIPTQDFSIGQIFTGSEARAIHNTIKQVAQLIRRMPAHYITFPNSDEQIFSVNIHRTTQPIKPLVLDVETLKSYGEFIVPKRMWQSMSFYACWIEPVVLNEWVAVMGTYNSELPQHELLSRLSWLNAERNTLEARQKVDSLILHGKQVLCVWSGELIQNNYAIDHCLPFSRWPNNDLWNLLPTLEKVNSSKSDKLPSAVQLNRSKKDILMWWENAWHEDSERHKFFIQAELTLPNLHSHAQDYEAVFDSLEYQRLRLFDQQQINSWDYV